MKQYLRSWILSELIGCLSAGESVVMISESQHTDLGVGGDEETVVLGQG